GLDRHPQGRQGHPRQPLAVLSRSSRALALRRAAPSRLVAADLSRHGADLGPDDAAEWRPVGYLHAPWDLSPAPGALARGDHTLPGHNPRGAELCLWPVRAQAQRG